MVQILTLGLVGPATGIPGGNHQHRVAVHHPVQNGLIRPIARTAAACHGRAQRQVDGVCPQDDGILNGRHIVRVIRTAACSEDFHGDDLGIRRHTLGLDRFQRRSKGTVSLGNVGICRCNALHMGTVLPLVVVVMGNIQIFVYVVEAKRNLGADIQILCSVAQTGNVQLAQLPADLSRIQQNGLCLLLLQGIVKGRGVKTLMIRINAGINDGNPAAHPRITGSPCVVRANHLGGSGHVGIRRLFLVHHTGGIAGFQNHILDPRQLPYGLHFSIRHVGGNQIGGQRQVPDHIQGFAVQRLGGNGRRHPRLTPGQPLAVGHGSGIFRNISRGVTRLQGGFPIQ